MALIGVISENLAIGMLGASATPGKGSERAMRTSRSAFWLLVALGATGLTARADQLRGVVRSVDAQAKKLMVKETGTDRLIDVMVPEEARLETTRGTKMLLKELHKGDGVGITHTDGVASQILVNQAPLLGTVSSLDPDDMKLVLTPTGSDKEVDVTTTSRTTFENASGKDLTFKDLKSGDLIAVHYDGPEVSQIVVKEKPDELVGHIKSVAGDLKSMVVTELKSNADTTIGINAKTSIVTTDGKPLEIKALKKGDGVGITHEKGLASKIVVNVREP